MITSTHVITNALLARRSRSRGATEMPAWLRPISDEPFWFALGGLAPDVGLTLLTAGAAVYFPKFKDMTMKESMDHAFSTLFFEDPGWITIQNTLHSPVVTGALTLLGRATGRPRLTAFALGCLLHTGMDIPVHHNDGPLVMFPFDWKTRINSPVSYYDKDHYGGIVAPVDLAITVAGAAFLAGKWWRDRKIW